MSIDPRFIDVDFLDDPNYVFGDLGISCFADMGPSYEEKFGAMSWTDIETAIEAIDAAGGGLDLLVKNILNQGREGSCVGNAFTQANMVTQAEMFGLEGVVELSAISLYKQIGRSASSGASVNNGIEKLCSVGQLPLDTLENRARFGSHVMPATGFSTKFPQGWQTTAKMFAGMEYHVVKSIEGIFTALCQAHPVVVGRQGHSIVYLRPMKGRKVKYANSWGDWGDNGFGYDTQSQIKQAATWAVAIRSVVTPKLKD